MGTGQMLLIIGALALLGTLSLAINSTILNKYTLIYEAEATIDAISVGQAMLDEALTKRFDKADTGSVKIFSPNEMTLSNLLGPETGEKNWTGIDSISASNTQFRSVTRFNDFDDYHRYERIVYTPRMGRFYLRDSVFYVVDNNPDAFSSDRTFQKKIIVTIWHPNLNVPVRVSDIAIYRRYF